MTIQLSPEQARFIEEKVRNGNFRNADEVLNGALAALREKEERDTAREGPAKTLVELLKEPPFAGSELNLERQRDFPRPLSL